MKRVTLQTIKTERFRFDHKYNHEIRCLRDMLSSFAIKYSYHNLLVDAWFTRFFKNSVVNLATAQHSHGQALSNGRFKPVFHLAFSREQAKSECMQCLSPASCCFLSSRKQIRLMENRLYSYSFIESDF